MNVQFRPATAGDLGAMQAIARHTIDTNYRAFIDDDGVDWFISGPSDDYVSKHVDDATLVTADGTIVGFTVCRDNLIDLIVIDDASHRRGFGSALLSHCESLLFERYDVIKLESFEGNSKANGFYRKHGWVKTGTARDPISGDRKWKFEKRRKS